MSALICGSMAYDTIMVFGDKFKNHILPDSVHMINVSFLVPEMRRETGGCAGNIAYNMKLLGEEPVIMATVGEDFDPYTKWLVECCIERMHIKRIDESYTAQAFITTDMDDNQITAFHPGAMSFSHENRVTDAKGISIGIVSPDGRDGMIEHAAQFVEADIPFIFDPGQGLPMFNGEELLTFVEQATWLTVNDYEGRMLQERTGRSLEELAAMVEALIVTKGGEGSDIYVDGQIIEIPTAKVAELNDPTGCGDAFRAGLIYGIEHKYDWDVTGRIASLCGGIKIEHHGTQNHKYSIETFHQRYRDSFGSDF